KALKAAGFMQKAFREGLFAPGFETMIHNDARDVFQAGQAVFMRSWPYVYRDMNKPNPDSQVTGKVGIAPLPTFAGAGPVNTLGGHNLAVSRFSDNPSAAAEFVRFVSTSKEAQRKLAELSYAPTLRETYTEMKGDPLIDLLGTLLPESKPRPADPEWTTISEEIQQQIFAAYTGDEDPGPEIDALRAFLAATAEDH
ncbi:MAG TPA: extracellular solute-binding protein, partial [Pseudonocardiaceae bacterium]|nr:extracellular solute-binding protein [Pseudonocardiaceae bacterium]